MNISKISQEQFDSFNEKLPYVGRGRQSELSIAIGNLKTGECLKIEYETAEKLMSSYNSVRQYMRRKNIELETHKSAKLKVLYIKKI